MRGIEIRRGRGMEGEGRVRREREVRGKKVGGV